MMMMTMMTMMTGTNNDDHTIQSFMNGRT